MRIKLLFDMNLSPRFAEHFSGKGYESKHWTAAGKDYASDSEIMEFAKINDYVVATYDLDFSAILAALLTLPPNEAVPHPDLSFPRQNRVAVLGTKKEGKKWKLRLAPVVED